MASPLQWLRASVAPFVKARSDQCLQNLSFAATTLRDGLPFNLDSSVFLELINIRIATIFTSYVKYTASSGEH